MQSAELDLIAAQLPEGVRLDSGDDVLCGRGEWLFERDGGRRALAQMRGDVILSPKAAQRWAYVLEARTAWLGERGIPYVFAVAPAKHVVLPDQLPAGVAVVPRRPVVQIVFWLDKHESQVEVVYPLEELQAATELQTFSTHDCLLELATAPSSGTSACWMRCLTSCRSGAWPAQRSASTGARPTGIWATG